MSYRRPAKVCVRCQRTTIFGRNWPEGFVCASCVRHGVLRRGRCPGCGTDRALPGLDGSGKALCVDCAGIPTSFRCATCGTEDEPFYARTCQRCSLRRRLSTVLAEGTETVPAAFAPFVEGLVTMAEPRRGLKWLNSPRVREHLRALASGTVALTHAGVDTLEPADRGREYLRELLMAHGVLPGGDKYLMAFERWEKRWLAQVHEPSDARLLRVYLRWRHHRELEARAAAGPLSVVVTSTARERARGALRLLCWLRERGVALDACTQTDLDTWFSSATDPANASDFLTWAMRHRHCPPLVLRRHRPRSEGRISIEHRNEVLARLLSDDQIPLGDRLAGCLVLLLAQPVSRLCALRVTDVERLAGGEMALRLGAEPVTLPHPVGALLSTYIEQRPHMVTAANPESPWLFPGHYPGQHLVHQQLHSRLARLGITVHDRHAALQDLVRRVPAAVVAQELGFHPNTTGRWADKTGTDWAGYAALRAHGSSPPT